ncbi:hypothetical protein N7450_009730 [Penicillium hetheringtonii]|nr:hypothetical protein N7450_009730 [Penicillium hetheringtonii]
MGQTIVILNDIQTALELLSKRSAKHSSRPKLVFASEMVGWEHILAMQTYSERFRAYRKAMQPYLGSEQAAAQYNTLQEIESHRFLFRVLKNPNKLSEHIQTEAGAVILKIAYGYTIEPHERDPLIHMANLALERFSIAGTPGAWLVDMMPILKFIPAWFPGAGFKHKAQMWKKNLEDVADRPYKFVQKCMESGRYEASYLSNLFKANGCPSPGSEEETIAKWTSASLYTGGADTTVSAIETFFLAMALFPDIQRKAQAEIEQVLGSCQLPKMSDRSRLPYVDAVVKEVLRWHPVAPMGIPHMSTEDDIWNEYLIPKGSLLMPNIWGLMHDPLAYHDPMSFKPERFLVSDKQGPEMDPHGIVFGFGRRICPGRFLADNTLYLTVARSLAVFNVEDDQADHFNLGDRPRFLPGVISHPVPRKFNITPRTPEHETLISSIETEIPWQKGDASSL